MLLGAVVESNGQYVYEMNADYTKSTVLETKLIWLLVLTLNLTFPPPPCRTLYSVQTELVSQNPDFSSILNVDGKIFSVTHYESPKPGVAYLSELEQDPKTGKLTVKQTKPVDFSAHGGVWVPCAGTVTPWETHLGSEEYEPDAKAFYAGPNVDNKVSDFLRYFGEYVDPATITPTQAMDKGFFPYRYGYPWETKVSADFTETTTKLYAHGRMSYELSYVMPDKKTVYETDDGQNVGFFKFVADTEGDLTEGVNYCAKFTQTSVAGSAAIDFTADVTWIAMPRASAAEVEAAIETETFETLFEDVACEADGSCKDITFRATNTGKGCECLKPRSGHHHLAATLEKRRYAGAAVRPCVHFTCMHVTTVVSFIKHTNHRKCLQHGWGVQPSSTNGRESRLMLIR